MKADSHQFHSIILPLISSSVAEDSNTRIFLLEDALELWTAILTQTSQPSPDILGLTAHLFPLYQSASENLKKSFELTEGYILLAPQALLEASPRFATVFSDLLSSNLKREANGIIATLVELLVRSAHALSGDSGVQHLAEILVRTEFLPALLTGLKSAHDSHQTTGPHRPFTDIDGIVETDYFAVLARILFYSPHSFVQAIVASSQTLGVSIPSPCKYRTS